MSTSYDSTRSSGDGGGERLREDGTPVTNDARTTTTPATPVQAGEPVEPAASVDRHEVVAREREAYGGIKFGSAFFGWLTATGTAVLLTALLTGAGTAIGVASNTSVAQATTAAQQDTKTVGVAGGIALLVILFIAYF